MPTILKTILSGLTPRQIRDQTDGLASVQLRVLAVQLAEDPDLTVSVITYADGRQELEVLHTGPPHHTEYTIDRHRFARQPDATPGRALSIATPAGFREAIALIRGILPEDAATLPHGSSASTT